MRKLAGGVSVGHWGTLDPAACGVLLLALGRATRLLQLLPHARKQYIFELIVGAKTDSGDATGATIEAAAVPDGWFELLPMAAQSLVGPTTQLPPMHSAVKVEGRPLYRSAHAGFEVPRAPRTTHIYQLRVLDMLGARSARLFVECEAGTYVRVLCEDLGEQIGLPAHMGGLVRTASGPFLLENSMLPQQIEANLAGVLINPVTVLSNPRIELEASSVQRFLHGNEVTLAAVGIEDHDEVLAVHDERLLGWGRVVHRDQRALLAPTRVLAKPAKGVDDEGAND